MRKRNNPMKMCNPRTAAADHLFMTKSQAGIAHIYLDTIQPALAEPYLEKALELAETYTIAQRGITRTSTAIR